ncbi:hypothetical protein BX616_001691 [Lobosporangium transversale]|uniref:LUD domain-containing protein n=1 Tax=Lobosporangium transversale TaxID=64571 RepID=A0A1Y2GP34_9FUNG|nr:hypothetical protein BCR41DRAFT_386114 [Lobosporangium transversale]KAF9903221.1 hypothetical protein BX616_001691 [Lobosporangium transversale]ORZ17470.1 hypothetical protein BCR41DRAFT_386114 [Lobosporangium transversale]|eukprot:XP_021881857.1 hypothetical protein BCR41DRAFT_386114 [Lobosporangium transversale]
MPSLIKKIKNAFKPDTKKSSTKKAIAPTSAAVTTAVTAPIATVVASTTAQTPRALSHPENTHVNHTFAALVKSDAQLAALADHHYTKPANAECVDAAKAALEANGFKVHLVNSCGEAFETLKGLIPAGASVNNAHSTTLEEIGFITYLKGETGWSNVHAQILAEKDMAKQAELRRTIGTTVDYYLTSMSAVTEDGKLAHADLSGSKVGGVAFGAANVIVVVGTNKIVKDEDEAWKRTNEFALAAESARARDAYGVPASAIVNYEVIRKANPFNPNRIQVVLVNDTLGF